VKIEDIDREFKELAQSMKDGQNALAEGRFGEAERQYLRAFELAKICYGPDHADALQCLHNLGDAYFGMRKYEKCLDTLQQLLAKREKLKYANDQEATSILFKMAKSNEKLGLIREAESFYRKALKSAEGSCGANQSFPATIMESFAGMLKRAQLHLGEAQQLEERVRDIRGTLTESTVAQVNMTRLNQLATSIAPGSDEAIKIAMTDKTAEKGALSGRMRSLRTHTEQAELPVEAPSPLKLRPVLACTIFGIVILLLGWLGYNMYKPTAVTTNPNQTTSNAPSSKTPNTNTSAFQTADARNKVILTDDKNVSLIRNGTMLKGTYSLADDTLKCRPTTSASVSYQYKRVPQGLIDDQNNLLYAADAPEALVISKMRHFAAALQNYYKATGAYPSTVDTIFVRDSSIKYQNPFTKRLCLPIKRELAGGGKDINDLSMSDFSKLENAISQLAVWTPNIGQGPGKIEYYRTLARTDGDTAYIRATDRDGNLIHGSQPGTAYLITLTQGQVRTGR
jgi:tetratricopeptide (TPR) repeat protein